MCCNGFKHENFLVKQKCKEFLGLQLSRSEVLVDNSSYSNKMSYSTQVENLWDTSFFPGRYKPGLWTLDWTMDWTMDWIMDWIMDLILDLIMDSILDLILDWIALCTN